MRRASKKNVHKRVCLLFVLILIGFANMKAFSLPKASAGVLDLRDWDFTGNNCISLDGEWLMYCERLLDPDDLTGIDLPEPLIQELPGYWKVPDVLPAQSFATYVLTILLPDSLTETSVVLGCRCSDVTSAGNVWIDGKKLFSSGVAAVNSRDEKPEFRPGTVFFMPGSTTLQVIMQVSNFHYRTGGIWAVPLFGTAGAISDDWSDSTQSVLFLLGALIILGIYQVCLFVSRHKEQSSLWFGLICIVISMRIVVTGNCLLNQWIPGFNWEIARKFEFFPIVLGPVFFSLFIRELFPDCMSRIPIRVNIAIGSAFALFILAFPTVVTSHLVIVFELYVCVAILWLLAKLAIALYRREKGSGWLLIGFIILALSVVNDILFSRLIVDSAYLLPLGFFAFVVSQVILLARRFTQGFNQSESFALELESTNKSFSRFVPTQFLQLLQRDRIVDVELGDQIERKLTVLFSDIRQFTTISETMSPRENFVFLNAYLRRIGPKIRENGGFIDKYIGDAIMALFPDSIESAIDAAVAIQRELAVFNEEQRAQNRPEIEIGLGLHSDMMVLGTIGEQGRMDTTVIADAVNLASRLESLSKTYGPGIMVVEALVSDLTGGLKYRFRHIGTVQIRGKKDAYPLIQIYEGLPAARVAKLDETRDDWEKAMEAYTFGDLFLARDLFELILERDSEDLAANYLYVQASNEIYSRI